MKLKHLCMPLLALAASGCDALSNKKDATQDRNQYTEPNATGCVQGVVMNGQTGERIALQGKAADEGLFVLAHATHLSGQPADNADFLKGEFVLCGVPLDESFPIFARFHGFNEFYSHVSIDSTVAQKSPKAAVDIRIAAPTRIANIRLYPLGVETQDLKVQVVHNATPVANATVRLTPQGRDYFDDANFLSPMNYRTQPAVVTTDGSGNAVFPKATLMLGATYNYDVLPPQGGSTDAAQSGTLTIGIGQLGNGQSDPYAIVVNLADSHLGALAQVSSSLDSADYDATGTIKLVFNRAIKISQGTEDKQTAFLNNAAHAKLTENVAGNGASEQMTVKVDGNTLTIQPIFATAPDAVADAGLTITYSGIMIQPTDGPGNTATKDLGNLTVKLYGGVDQPKPAKYAQTLELTSGNTQTGIINQALASPLKVRAYDQFGDPFAGQNVTFELQAQDGGGALSAFTIATDSMGYGQTTWTLGSAVGTQTVLVTAVSATLGGALKNSPMSFSATAQAPSTATTMTIDSGNAQTAQVNQTLATPVRVKVVDQSGAAIANQKVDFEPNNGGSLSAYSVYTDGGGFAATTWTLGAAAGSQALTARAFNGRGDQLGTLTISATATPAPTPPPPPTVTPTATGTSTAHS